MGLAPRRMQGGLVVRHVGITNIARCPRRLLSHFPLNRQANLLKLWISRTEAVPSNLRPHLVSIHTGAGIGAPRRAVALRARGTRSDTVQKSLAGVVYSVGASFSDSPKCSGVAYTESVRKRGGESCLTSMWPPMDI
jgi:hypothetical protein